MLHDSSGSRPVPYVILTTPFAKLRPHVVPTRRPVFSDFFRTPPNKNFRKAPIMDKSTHNTRIGLATADLAKQDAPNDMGTAKNMASITQLCGDDFWANCCQKKQLLPNTDSASPQSKKRY